MALLELRNIGKIYVSDNSIAVGIRGVTLDFDLGEFVAVTGKSGSGKTTLLNCISGMDSYEEGELYINGSETSHFTQTDWEEYRQRYISFIFQDYNIIDSFTVLQNVELALTHIDSRAERRRRALELIERVGMTSHKNSKGSKLSGGQKQRTVIARALAKDSPIILADEPTGNLDSKTGQEIVELLAEVGREKLVIVVTHSASQFEGVATREVRIYDGGVERDEQLTPREVIEYEEKDTPKRKNSDLKLGFELGRHKFFASPKLSVFMCLIMIVAMLGCFFVTSIYCVNTGLDDMSMLFTYHEGRLVISRQDGEVMSDGELQKLSDKLGAVDIMHYDHLLDKTDMLDLFYGEEYYSYLSQVVKFKMLKDESPDVGRRPAGAGECMLLLPIGWQDYYGEDELLSDSANVFTEYYNLKVVGVDYYYDNTRPYGHVVLTREGFDALTGVSVIEDTEAEVLADISVTTDHGGYGDFYKTVSVDDTLTGKSFYIIGSDVLVTAIDDAAGTDRVSATVVKNSYMSGETAQVSLDLSGEDVVFRRDMCRDHIETMYTNYATGILYVSPELADIIADGLYHDKYTQASLFFENDSDAKNAKEKLSDLGYVGIVSNEEYDADGIAMLSALATFMGLGMWALSLLFLSLFLSLCSVRVLSASNSDFAIMRSMGISARIVKISMYSRMMIAIVPALVALAVIAPAIYLRPSTNAMFPFLHAQHYLLIVAGLVIESILVTKRCNKKIFGKSVIKTLKGGEKS